MIVMYMKLNNKGWGYRMMALLMTILVIFLIVAIFFIYKFYTNVGKNIINNPEYIGGR